MLFRSARLLTDWNLPERLVAIVRDHHEETIDAGNLPLVVVRLANLCCRKAGIGVAAQPDIAPASAPEASLLGMSDVAVAELELILEDLAVAV